MRQFVEYFGGQRCIVSLPIIRVRKVERTESCNQKQTPCKRTVSPKRFYYEKRKMKEKEAYDFSVGLAKALNAKTEKAQTIRNVRRKNAKLSQSLVFARKFIFLLP